MQDNEIKFCIIEPRVGNTKNKNHYLQVISKFGAWIYFVDYPEMAQKSSKVHIYDNLEIKDWRIIVDWKNKDIIGEITLKERYTKPRTPKVPKVKDNNNE